MFFKKFTNYRRQQRKRSCHEEEQANGTSEEDIEVAITHNQGANEVLFCHATKNYADNNCRHGEAKLVEEVPYKTGSYHQVHVVDGVVIRISTNEGHHHDNGKQNMHRHIYNLCKQANQGEAHNTHDDISKKQTDEDCVNVRCLFYEKQGTGL